MEVLVENLTFLTWQQVLMWLIGGVLIYLAIVKEMEPSPLLPQGFDGGCCQWASARFW